MELSSSNIKRLLIFSYISRNGTFQPKLENNKKIHRKKISFASGKWNFLTLILKNFLYFLERKLFLYFAKRKPRKNPYISGNGNPKKLRIFQEVIFLARKIKKLTLKKFLIFQEVTCKA